ncbi:MAG: hypothetical protein P8Y48_19185, partial [Novosphingobium sp.]
VAIFYGHPGIFAAPGHRAIHQARREGHSARMRPGISALDSLIADIGFDPGLPGLLTYEATDMLLRRRRLDPTLHTVIWQVGVVGELGYSRQGYTNRGLPQLLDAIEAAYGETHEILHYIGSQYVGAEPVIERLTTRVLRNSETSRKLQTLSTFYLPPAIVADTDIGLAAAFGATPLKAKPIAQSHMASYGPRGIHTLKQLSDLRFSAGYKVQDWNAVLRLLLKLSEDVEFRARFEADPANVLDGPEGASLTERQKSLLFVRDQRAVIAAINEAD